MSMVVGRVFLSMDGITPSYWRKVIGYVRVRIRSSAKLRGDLLKLSGPWIWVKLNGVCYGIACFNAPGGEDAMQCADVDIHVPVHSFREAIVLETYTSDGFKELILGGIGILVTELASSALSSISQLHHYAIQELEGQLTVEYNLSFSYTEKKLEFGQFEHCQQFFQPMLPTIPNHDSDAEIPATLYEAKSFTTAPRADLDGLRSLSSGVTTFGTVRSDILADQTPVPGGLWDFCNFV
ncbi:hypothetical protein FRC04_004585 [Tulasnella sp. 424]|nr:hypothetical protein FRC04_004585 [Tulasnella sp. 424]KAG8964126.1 hypothetical protein FRC05_004280 [Tulasnella sp. 425]